MLVFNFSDLRQAAFLLFFSISFGCLPCLLLGGSYNFSAKQEFIEHCHDVSMRVIAGLVMFCVFGLFFSMQLGSFKDVIPELREVVTGGLVLWWPCCLA